jgi:hypothetical protein
MTYDMQLLELKIINLICSHNGIGKWAIGRRIGVHHTSVGYWLARRAGPWGIYEDDEGKLYLTWHHGGMEWRLPGGCVVDANAAEVV